MTGKLSAKKLANRILRMNRKGRSYRVMSREDFPGVKPGTLNRIAKEKGGYVPTDEKILVALGLKKPRKPSEWNQKRSIVEAMSQIVKQALRWKKSKRLQ